MDPKKQINKPNQDVHVWRMNGDNNGENNDRNNGGGSLILVLLRGYIPSLLFKTLVHFYLSSHFFFSFEVPSTCSFLFPHIFFLFFLSTHLLR